MAQNIFIGIHQISNQIRCMMGKVKLAIILLLTALSLIAAATPSQSTCNLTENSLACNIIGTNLTRINSNSLLGKPVNIAFAYSKGCPHCAALEAYLQNLSRSYDLNVTYVDAIVNQSALEGYLFNYKVPESDWGTVPILFMNNTYCIGDTPCEGYLSQNLPYFAEHGTPVPVSLNHLTGLKIAEFTGLALVDSINPCAFAVLIFLLSTLFMRDPNNRHKILFGGLAFATGIFSFYFAVGILLLFGIKSALAITNLRNIYIYGAFGVFSIILGVLNLKDYFAYRSLGFAMEVPLKWRPKMLGTIDVIMLKFASVPAAFAAGVLVTVFLLPCITGPYFVAGSLLKDLPFSQSVLWLAYYNILFVLPMFVITALVYMSLTSVEKAAKFRENNIRKLHLIAGVLLIAVGIVILLQVV